MNKMMTRKEFLKSAALGASALLCAGTGYGFLGKSANCTGSIKGHITRDDAPEKPWKWSIEGFHYTSQGKKVQCQVCPNRCILGPGDRSICRSKVNIEGKLYSLTYGNPCAVHLDPIEKKPLFNFMPGTTAYSIGTMGCNFRCKHCQNFDISQHPRKNRGEVLGAHRTPEQIVAAAKNRRLPNDRLYLYRTDHFFSNLLTIPLSWLKGRA